MRGAVVHCAARGTVEARSTQAPIRHEGVEGVYCKWFYGCRTKRVRAWATILQRHDPPEARSSYLQTHTHMGYGLHAHASPFIPT